MTDNYLAAEKEDLDELLADFRRRTEKHRKRLLDMRSNPFRLIREEPDTAIMAARGGKTTVLLGMIGQILDAAIGHKQRMRGRYVHSRKGRVIRQHRLRISYMDRKPFRKRVRPIKQENGDG